MFFIRYSNAEKKIMVTQMDLVTDGPKPLYISLVGIFSFPGAISSLGNPILTLIMLPNTSL